MDSETVTAPPDPAFRQQVLASIEGALPGVLGHDIGAIHDGTQLMAELGLRSATMLELLLEVEDALEIQVDVEEIDQDDMNTVGDLADFVAGHAVTDG